jgi:hypothetical protein
LLVDEVPDELPLLLELLPLLVLPLLLVSDSKSSATLELVELLGLFEVSGPPEPPGGGPPPGPPGPPEPPLENALAKRFCSSEA